MVCEGCGYSAPVLKTCRWRTGERYFSLCDSCYELVEESVFIVAGPLPAHGKCRGCSGWFSTRELEDLIPGGKWDAPTGLCLGCRLH